MRATLISLPGYPETMATNALPIRPPHHYGSWGTPHGPRRRPTRAPMRRTTSPSIPVWTPGSVWPAASMENPCSGTPSQAGGYTCPATTRDKRVHDTEARASKDQRAPWAPTQETSKHASTRDTRFSAINRQRRTHQKFLSCFFLPLFSICTFFCYLAHLARWRRSADSVLTKQPYTWTQRSLVDLKGVGRPDSCLKHALTCFRGRSSLLFVSRRSSMPFRPSWSPKPWRRGDQHGSRKRAD